MFVANLTKTPFDATSSIESIVHACKVIESDLYPFADTRLLQAFGMALGKPKATHQFTFPPFPKAPEGVPITPFAEYMERGIQVYLLGEEDYELDGAGKPTVALAKKHDTDKCKTDAKPRPAKPAQVAVKKADGTIGVRKKEWWEEWEENDRYRAIVAYNP